jgi:hypothetical protein
MTDAFRAVPQEKSADVSGGEKTRKY